MKNTEFENLILFLENESFFNLGIQIAENYKEDFEKYFGISLDKYKRFDELYLNYQTYKNFKIFVNVNWVKEFGYPISKMFQFYTKVQKYKYMNNNFIKEYWDIDFFLEPYSLKTCTKTFFMNFKELNNLDNLKILDCRSFVAQKFNEDKLLPPFTNWLEFYFSVAKNSSHDKIIRYLFDDKLYYYDLSFVKHKVLDFILEEQNSAKNLKDYIITQQKQNTLNCEFYQNKFVLKILDILDIILKTKLKPRASLKTCTLKNWI